MRRLTPIAALAAVLLSACGSSAGTTARTTAGTTAAPDTTVPAPQAIVSLSPTATEMLFAIGAGDQVIAVDDQSNYPADALKKPHDLSGYQPNVEAIAALKPDLVVVSDPAIRDQLTKLGVTVWVGPAAITFDDVYQQIEQLGAATGHVADSARVVAKMQKDIAVAVAKAPKPSTKLKVYHELDNTLYSVTSHTFIGQVYSLFGLTNIADNAQPGNDYPQLNAEYVVTANPDIIFLADSKCCAQDRAAVAARPGWSAIAAVSHGDVVAMDDDIASRWGPRLVDYVQAVSDALAKVPAGG